MLCPSHPNPTSSPVLPFTTATPSPPTSAIPTCFASFLWPPPRAWGGCATSCWRRCCSRAGGRQPRTWRRSRSRSRSRRRRRRRGGNALAVSLVARGAGSAASRRAGWGGCGGHMQVRQQQVCIYASHGQNFTTTTAKPAPTCIRTGVSIIKVCKHVIKRLSQEQTTFKKIELNPNESKEVIIEIGVQKKLQSFTALDGFRDFQFGEEVEEGVV